MGYTYRHPYRQPLRPKPDMPSLVAALKRENDRLRRQITQLQKEPHTGTQPERNSEQQ